MSYKKFCFEEKKTNIKNLKKRGMGYHMQEKAIYVPGIFMFKQNLH